jgi:DNA polymerase
MKNGLIDYLEIMQMAGVSELGHPVTKKDKPFDDPVTETIISASPEEQHIETQVAVQIETQIDVQVDVQVDVPIEEMPPADVQKLPTERDENMSSAKPTAKPSLTSIRSKSERLHLLAQEVARCSRCEELARTRTQTVFGVGNPDAELVFLGEAPGADEDRQGEPFVGRAGQLLNDIMTKGMKIRREDVFICNILRCRPPSNRTPLPAEAECCRLFLEDTLEIVKPKFICCLGAVAAQNLLQTTQTIGSLRGKIFDYNGIIVVCTYHPAYLLRNPSAKKQTWEDIQILMNEMGLPIQ